MAWDAKSIADVLGWQWIETRQEYAGLCPCHHASGSHEANAGVKDTSTGILFKCFAGCSYATFLAHLHETTPHKTSPPPSRSSCKQEVARYAYEDEQGAILFYVIRYAPKTFRMALPSTNGQLHFSTKTLSRRVIYRLPRVLEATHPVFFVEGEKDVHTLEALGCTATCVAGGADGWAKWATDYIAQLATQDLIIIPDNDEAGHRLATQIQTAMAPVAKRVRLLELPDAPPGGDITDWVQAGGTQEALWQLVASLSATEDSSIIEISATDLMAKTFKPIRWFAAGLLHEGMILFGGKSKRGKSWIMMNLALSIATGGNVFGHYEVPQPAKVLYCALEDGPRRTQRRLSMIDAHADMSLIHFAFRMPPLDEGGMTYIAQHITEGFEVIVVDVLAHVETPGKHGLRDYHEVYRTFAPLQQLRADYSFAIVMVTHLRKAESEEVFDDLHGSVAYQGAQDALWVLDRKGGDNTANLHLRDKDAEDKVIELQFDGAGIWSFLGEGEEHTASVEENNIIKFLLEESQPQSVKDIIQGLGMHPGKYAALRKRLQRMAAKSLIVRTDRGKYISLGKDFEDAPYV